MSDSVKETRWRQCWVEVALIVDGRKRVYAFVEVWERIEMGVISEVSTMDERNSASSTTKMKAYEENTTNTVRFDSRAVDSKDGFV